MTDPEQVVVKDNQGRTHFAGLYEDAKTFIANHFPRPHVEPGSFSQDAPDPDAHIVRADGSKETLHGDAGWKSDAEPADEPVADAVPEEGQA